MFEGDQQVSRRAVLGGVGAGAAALAGCATIAGEDATSHLRVGTVQPPTTLDPVAAEDVGSARVVARVFEGLYTYGEGTDLVPSIAAAEPSIDDGGRRVTVEIDDAATFQNGDPVTPADVRYSYEAPGREDAPSRWAVSPIEAVETVDDRTVRFRLEHPFPGLAHALTHPVVPEDLREADRERFAREPVGAGAFRVRSFSAGKKATLTRWEDYPGDPAPAVDRVTFAYVESPVTQLTGLVTGRSDVVEPISPRYRRDVRSLTDAEVAERAGFRSFYFGFNCNEGPTTDRAVREGVARSIDLEKAVRDFVAPVGRRQHSLLPRRVAEDWDLPVDEWAAAAPERDVQAAKERFESASVPVGKLTILTSKHPVWKELAHELAAGLRDAGQSALVDAVSWTTYLKRYVTGSPRDYNVFVGEVAGTGDPDSFLYPVVHENAQGGTNGVFYNEESVMNHLRTARERTDRAQRRSHYESAIAKLHEDRPYLPICSFKESFAHAPAVRDLRAHPIAELNPRLTSPDGVVRKEGR